jgi:type I restriction-modification system DNA methylase subunit
VCDPCWGTGGFLAESAEHMRRGGELGTQALDALRHHTFYGLEKDNLAYPIALANRLMATRGSGGFSRTANSGRSARRGSARS